LERLENIGHDPLRACERIEGKHKSSPQTASQNVRVRHSTLQTRYAYPFGNRQGQLRAPVCTLSGYSSVRDQLAWAVRAARRNRKPRSKL